MKATEKHVGFAIRLLRKAGYPTDFLSKRSHGKYANFRDIKNASGRVENWLRNMTRDQISELIDQLEEEAK